MSVFHKMRRETALQQLLRRLISACFKPSHRAPGQHGLDSVATWTVCRQNHQDTTIGPLSYRISNLLLMLTLCCSVLYNHQKIYRSDLQTNSVNQYGTRLKCQLFISKYLFVYPFMFLKQRCFIHLISTTRFKMVILDLCVLIREI